MAGTGRGTPAPRGPSYPRPRGPPNPRPGQRPPRPPPPLLDRDMFRNILFYLGVQWIDYDLRNRVWLPRAAKKSIPNPVTNKFADVQRPIVSLLAGEEPHLYYRPRTDAEEDISTAFV